MRTPSTSLVLKIALALTALTFASIACGPSDDDPCQDDPFGCLNNDNELVFDDACTLEGPLELSVGWGQGGFNSFEVQPEIHSGSQGGQHVYFAATIDNADWADHPSAELNFRLFELLTPEQCADEVMYARENNPEILPEDLRNDPDATLEARQPMWVMYAQEQDPDLPVMGESRCMRSTYSRSLVLTDREAVVQDDGSVRVDNLLMELSYSDGDFGVVVDGIDPCRREGTVFDTFSTN